jgi:ATP/maltotriose-dependent transcriptional regulator MalT
VVRALSEIERRIVGLIADGYDRAGIADQLDLADATVKRRIKKLCGRYQCPMRDLPVKAGVAAEQP